MTVDEAIEAFQSHLARKGLKYTRQRRAIAEVFFGSGAHLSLNDVHALAKAKQAGVGYATVYRTMKLMAECGLADEHKFAEGHVRYEPSGDHHDHLICTTCGLIVEYEDARIEQIQEEMAEKHGFRVVGHRHEIYGECVKPNCAERGRLT